MSGRHVLWEHLVIPDPAAHRGKYRRRWAVLAVVVAAVTTWGVVSFGVWGLVYTAILVVPGGGMIEAFYRIPRTLKDPRVWTDGSLFGVDGTHKLLTHPDDPVPISQIRAVSVYPVLWGYNRGSNSRSSSTIIDLWLVGGDRRIFTFPSLPLFFALPVEAEHSLAVALYDYFGERWRGAPDEHDFPSDFDAINQRRLDSWPR